MMSHTYIVHEEDASGFNPLENNEKNSNGVNGRTRKTSGAGTNSRKSSVTSIAKVSYHTHLEVFYTVHAVRVAIQTNEQKNIKNYSVFLYTGNCTAHKGLC